MKKSKGLSEREKRIALCAFNLGYFVTAPYDIISKEPLIHKVVFEYCAKAAKKARKR